jgi:hypothetical protein
VTKPSDLTTRDAVKSWQGIVGAASDTQIDALVSAASRTSFCLSPSEASAGRSSGLRSMGMALIVG